MVCSKCESENPLTSNFCQKCGNSLKGKGLWNPNAIVNWSILFSPVFGAYFQMLNWRALGESEREASSRRWFYISIAIILLDLLLPIFINDLKDAHNQTRGFTLGLYFLFAAVDALNGRPINSGSGAPSSIHFLLLVIWYLMSGRKQAKYMKDKLGKSYVKNSWGSPLVAGLGILFLYAVAYVLAGLVFVATRKA